RGGILRDAGRYQAAEVAYEGAAQAAEHAEQRQGAEREIAITRRYAFYAPRRPEDLSPAERWFAETGTVVLASDPGPDVPDDAALVAAASAAAPGAPDVFGVLSEAGRRRARRINLAHALSEAQHPAARVSSRRLKS